MLIFALRSEGYWPNHQAVTWRVEQGGIGTIDDTGLYTAPRSIYGAPFHVVATSHRCSPCVFSMIQPHFQFPFALCSFSAQFALI
jgi:hypothetical protein